MRAAGRRRAGGAAAQNESNNTYIVGGSVASLSFETSPVYLPDSIRTGKCSANASQLRRASVRTFSLKVNMRVTARSHHLLPLFRTESLEERRSGEKEEQMAATRTRRALGARAVAESNCADPDVAGDFGDRESACSNRAGRICFV